MEVTTVGCPYPGERLSAYADRELPPEEMTAVCRHLDGCAECRVRVVELASLRTALAAGASAPPPELAARVNSAVAAAPAVAELTCDEVRPLFDLWVYDELSGATFAAVEIHCLFCPECSTAYRQMLSQVQLLQQLPAVAVPADLRSRIAAAMAHSEVSAWQVWRERIAGAFQWRTLPIGLAAAATAVALLALTQPAPRMQPQSSLRVAHAGATAMVHRPERPVATQQEPLPSRSVVVAKLDAWLGRSTAAPRTDSELRREDIARRNTVLRARSDSRLKPAPSGLVTTTGQAVMVKPAGIAPASAGLPDSGATAAPDRHSVPAVTATAPAQSDTGTPSVDVDYRPPTRPFVAPSLAGDNPDTAPQIADASADATPARIARNTAAQTNEKIARREPDATPVTVDMKSDPLRGLRKSLRGRTFAGAGDFDRGGESRLLTVDVVRVHF